MVASRLSGLGSFTFAYGRLLEIFSSVFRVVLSMYGALWLRNVLVRMDGVLGGDVVLMRFELGDIHWCS